MVWVWIYARVGTNLIIGLILRGTAREHEALMARNMMSNHIDMQDKYCGDCYDIHSIQNIKKETTKEVAQLCILALNKVNIVSSTTILVLHVGNGRSEHV